MDERTNAGAKLMLASGGGTLNDPILVTNKEEFLSIRNNLTAYYKLTADIDFNGSEVEPIGTSALPFAGGLDGDGHVIRGARVNSTVRYVGLFGYAKSAKLKNLVLENVEITAASSNIGALSGYLASCTTENIHLKDIRISGGSTVGSLVGGVYGGKLINCFAEDVAITGVSTIGGLIGATDNCQISGCSVNGSVTGQGGVGGLIGHVVGKVTDSFAVGVVISTEKNIYTGGLIGNATKADILNCYASCQISEGGSGLATTPKSARNSFFDALIAGPVKESSKGYGKLTVAMLKKITYIDWDFNNIWDIKEGSSYPYLRGSGVSIQENIDTGLISLGAGLQIDPYLIGSDKELEFIRYDMNGFYKLTADIDFEDKQIEPIGTKSFPFRGGLDGNGHTLKRFRVNAIIDYAGLFGYASSARFKDLRLENVWITTSRHYAGALVGCYLGIGGSVDNIRLVDINISGGSNIGALAGVMDGGLLNRCTAKNVSINSSINKSSNTGGLIGMTTGNSLRIYRCSSSGNVTGEANVGGLIGYAEGTINDCYSMGSVLSLINDSFTGGLVGNGAKVNIKNCYSACQVSEKGSGLVTNPGSIINSYYDGLVAKQVISTRKNVAKLTVAMIRKANYVGWDFEKEWDIMDGTTYPYLRGEEMTSGEDIEVGFVTAGIGTEEDPYLIDGAEALEYIRYDMAGFYKLIKDINFNGREIKPIGNANMPFKGGLDGGGNAIKRLQASYNGLFCRVEEAKFKGLVLQDVEIISNVSSLGALAGSVDRCTIENILLKNINIVGTSYMGALAGTVSGGSLTNCFAENVTISSTITNSLSVGGLIGKMLGSNSRLMGCCVIGDVTGGADVGGLIGNAEGYVDNSYVIGNVQSVSNSNYVGGLIGNAAKAYISNCFTSCQVSERGNGLACIPKRVTNSYFDSNVAGIATPEAQARTTEQMLTKETYLGWDWENIWSIKEGAYPNLKYVELVSQEPFELTYRELSCNSVIIEWKEVPGAIGYDFVYLNRVEHVETTRAVIEGLDPDTEYVFQARAKLGDTVKIRSKSLKIRTASLRIDGLHSISKGSDSITLSWEKTDNAVSYDVIINNNVILATESNTCTITGLDPDAQYVIQIRANKKDGTAIISNPLMEGIYILNPQTDYAQEFINKCEGQTWFTDEIENILKLKGKSINTITSRMELASIYAIGLADRKITGKLPAAIGELSQLRYLYLANNNLSGDLPKELSSLVNIIEMDLSGNQFSLSQM